MKIFILISLLASLVILFAFVGLNYRQLYAMWAIRREKKKLLKQEVSPNFQNPDLADDFFKESISSAFWKYIILNGGGKVSNETAWHAVAITTSQELTIHHFPDAAFENESSNLFDKPAAGQYNNTSLIGREAYQPTPGNDLVLEFTLEAGKEFYGTAGVVFQLAGTIEQNGTFVKPFDMFGVSIVGAESSVFGRNGPLCYLALDWNPVDVVSLQVDSHTKHSYQIRLRWEDETHWAGFVYVDGAKMCSMLLPPLGPVEVHVWSDNYLVTSMPRRWWEIAPSMELKFQDGGDKQFHVGKIKIHTEAR